MADLGMCRREPGSTTLTSALLPLLREALAKEGAFRCPLRGDSMRPTLPSVCEIEIVPLPARVPLGTLIVFMAGDTLIAHRLVRREGSAWIAHGDARLGPDAPVAPEQVLGVVTAAYAGGRRCWPPRYAGPPATFWVARHWALWTLRFLRRLVRRSVIRV